MQPSGFSGDEANIIILEVKYNPLQQGHFLSFLPSSMCRNIHFTNNICRFGNFNFFPPSSPIFPQLNKSLSFRVKCSSKLEEDACNGLCEGGRGEDGDS